MDEFAKDTDSVCLNVLDNNIMNSLHENQNHSNKNLTIEDCEKTGNSVKDQMLYQNNEVQKSLEFDNSISITNFVSNEKNSVGCISTLPQENNIDSVLPEHSMHNSLPDLNKSSLNFETNCNAIDNIKEIIDDNEVIMRNMEEEIFNADVNDINIASNNDEACHELDAILHKIPVLPTDKPEVENDFVNLSQIIENRDSINNDLGCRLNNSCVGKRKREDSEENREVKITKIEQKNVLEVCNDELHNGDENKDDNEGLTRVNNEEKTDIEEHIPFEDERNNSTNSGQIVNTEEHVSLQNTAYMKTVENKEESKREAFTKIQENIDALNESQMPNYVNKNKEQKLNGEIFNEENVVNAIDKEQESEQNICDPSEKYDKEMPQQNSGSDNLSKDNSNNSKQESLDENTEETLEKYSDITENSRIETLEDSKLELSVTSEKSTMETLTSEENTKETPEENEETVEEMKGAEKNTEESLKHTEVVADNEEDKNMEIVEKLEKESNVDSALESNQEPFIEDTNVRNEEVPQETISKSTEISNDLHENITEMSVACDSNNVEDTELPPIVIGEAFSINEEQMDEMDTGAYVDNKLESTKSIEEPENVAQILSPKVNRKALSKSGNSSRKKSHGKKSPGKTSKKYRRSVGFGFSKKKKKIARTPKSSVGPYVAPVKTVFELPSFLEELGNIDSSLIVVRDRYNEEGKKIKVYCIAFNEIVLDWAISETLLSSIENSKTLRKKLKMKMGGQLMFPDNLESKMGEIYPVMIGEQFPFAMPRIGEVSEVKNDIEEEVQFSFPLEQLCELCPSAAGQRSIGKTKRRLNSVTFADEPLEWAFKETFLSTFEDSPILSDLLGLNSSTKKWPDVTEEILSHETIDYTFPFACPNSKKFYESLLFNNLSLDLPSTLIHETLQLSPLPAYLEKNLYEERDSLVRLLSVASFYKHSSCIPTIRSNRKLSLSHSALIESFRPLIISQANRLAVVVKEARKKLLMGVTCQDVSIIPAMISGPIHCKRGIIFSNIQKLEAAVSKDPNNKLQNI